MDSIVNIPLPSRKSRSNNAPIRYDLIIGGSTLRISNLILVPTATTQVVLTQVFAPQGRGTEELNALSAYLLH